MMPEGIHAEVKITLAYEYKRERENSNQYNR
jgi:hypothetical protein